MIISCFEALQPLPSVPAPLLAIPVHPSEPHWDLLLCPELGSSHCSDNTRSFCSRPSHPLPALLWKCKKRLLIDENSSTITLWWASYDYLLQWCLQNTYSCQSTRKSLGWPFPSFTSGLFLQLNISKTGHIRVNNRVESTFVDFPLF